MTRGHPLTTATEAALRASIARFGVIVPVVVDQYGNVLDGHNRTRIGRALGVEVPSKVQHVADDAEAQEVARTLNEDRRHMPKKEREEVVRALRAEGHSTRAIAATVGVSVACVHKDIKSGVHECTAAPDTVTGLDGKTYQPTREPKGKPGPKRSTPESADAEWLRLRRLGKTQEEAARDAGLKRHDIRRVVAEHGDPLPMIGGMNAYEMLDAQTRQLDVAASLIGQIVEVIDPAHPGVRDFLLAIQKMRTAGDNAERALRRASLKVMA
jgi:hypothetical protein